MDGLVIGLDLNDDYTQISCYGNEISWTVPTVICRKKEEEIWLTGEDAYAATLIGEGVIVDKLLKMVKKEGTATIGGICYTGASLLKIFLERILEYPFKENGKKRVAQLVVTMQTADARVTDTLMYCADAMEIPRERVHVISHTESFAYYVLSQRKELWSNQVGLFELAADRLCYYEMKVQRGMRRNMVQAEAQEQEESFNLDILDTLSGRKLADQILSSCGEKLLSKKQFSTVFLTGKGFERADCKDWAGSFMNLVCSHRRVFVEKGLFARGAALKGQDYMNPVTEYPYIFVCEGRLKAEVALKVMRNGREVLLAVASYGDNWYESKSSLELILEDEKEIEFIISHLDSRKKKIVKVPLTGFPNRPPKTTRIEMNIGFTDENTMVTVIRDKGFGELFPAAGAVVRQEVSL